MHCRQGSFQKCPSKDRPFLVYICKTTCQTKGSTVTGTLPGAASIVSMLDLDLKSVDSNCILWGLSMYASRLQIRSRSMLGTGPRKESQF